MDIVVKGQRATLPHRFNLETEIEKSIVVIEKQLATLKGLVLDVSEEKLTLIGDSTSELIEAGDDILHFVELAKDCK